MARKSHNPFGDRFPTVVVDSKTSDDFVVRAGDGHAVVSMDEVGPGVADLEFVFARQQRKGVGTHLTLVAAQEAAARGATTFHAQVIDEREMRIFGRLFKEENLTFVEYRPDGPWVLPMSLSRAVASIALSDAMFEIFKLLDRNPPDGFDPQVTTLVDLTSPAVCELAGLLPPIPPGN